MATVGGMLLAVTLWACSFSSRWLLENADETIKAVPVASFFREVAAWKAGPKSRFKTVPTKVAQTQADQVMAADLMELKTALLQTGLKGQPLEQRLAMVTRLRGVLKDYAEKLENWQANPYDWQTGAQVPRPLFKEMVVPAGLPAEFADYLRGSIAYYAGQSNIAYQSWTALLQRPPAERHYRSTWAEYMLGRMQVETAPEQAVLHFQKVRELAGVGYADSLGLAAASLGWEARAWLLLKNHKRAIELYSEQIATGDKNHAVVSLQRTVKAAFGQSDAAVKVLAQDALCRRVVTAALISRSPWSEPLVNPEVGNAAMIWLRVLEESGTVEVELAEQLALAAYQAGQFELADRWLRRAPKDSATARWVQAKLLLRAGKLDAAAQVLRELTGRFPVLANEGDRETSPELLDRIYILDPPDEMDGPAYGRREIMAELGVLQLSRKDFVAALDCFIRSQFFADAAYIAERVLTLGELKAYVDRNTPAKQGHPAEADAEGNQAALRHLLACRLARANRWPEARAYFPPELLPTLDQRLTLIARGQDKKLPAKQRAAALWQAAVMTYDHGGELLGMFTEVRWNPEGPEEYDPLGVQSRWQQQTNELAKTSREELLRVAAQEAPPHDRRNYRYWAADLAWQATELMPDQAEETAKHLYEAGSWLKHKDAKSANRFYRALVLRCNKTDFGRLAEKLRWFPPVDSQGRPYMPKRKPKQKNEAPAFVPAVDSLPIL